MFSYLLNNTRMQNVNEKELLNVSVRHQYQSALQVHRIIFKDIKNKYEDQQVTKLQRKFSNRKVS